MNKDFRKSVYNAIYKSLEEGSYQKDYPVVDGYKLRLWEPDEDRDEPWFEKSVCLESPKGHREVFTIAWDRKTRSYRIPTFAQLFAGEINLISECAREITKWVGFYEWTLENVKDISGDERFELVDKMLREEAPTD
jgi:hypothetical protein